MLANVRLQAPTKKRETSAARRKAVNKHNTTEPFVGIIYIMRGDARLQARRKSARAADAAPSRTPPSAIPPCSGALISTGASRAGPDRRAAGGSESNLAVFGVACDLSSRPAIGVGGRSSTPC